MEKTLRLTVPDWQAGQNPVYRLGAEILTTIAPENYEQDSATVRIPDQPAKLEKENGVFGQSIVKQNVIDTAEVIQKYHPNKIITLGGNCLVSQAPVDYLNGYYDGNLAVIWVDAHPDISTPEMFYNEHAMVLGNLLNAGDPALAGLVQHPITADQVFYPALSEPLPHEKDELKRLGISYQTQVTNTIDFSNTVEWLKKHDFKKIFVHFDIDVMDPKSFYATFFNDPALSQMEIPDNAAIGKITQESAWNYVSQLSQKYDLVGLTIAEYMPWSALQMRNLMKNIKIF